MAHTLRWGDRLARSRGRRARMPVTVARIPVLVLLGVIGPRCRSGSGGHGARDTRDGNLAERRLRGARNASGFWRWRRPVVPVPMTGIEVAIGFCVIGPRLRSGGRRPGHGRGLASAQRSGVDGDPVRRRACAGRGAGTRGGARRRHSHSARRGRRGLRARETPSDKRHDNKAKHSQHPSAVPLQEQLRLPLTALLVLEAAPAGTGIVASNTRAHGSSECGTRPKVGRQSRQVQPV